MIYILNIKLNIYMKKKFILFILTSSNEKLLKISYNSAINQKNHNLDYSIIIVVNSLDVTYFKKIKIEFENIDVEIIQTPSNGKPGMGHNSCIELFKIRKLDEWKISLFGINSRGATLCHAHLCTRAEGKPAGGLSTVP